jgi:quercetin dioxygenase-like cupin family protein
MEKINELEVPYRDGNSGVKYLFRGPYAEGGVILLLPGQRLGAHYHNQLEEVFYFAEGNGTIYINGEPHKAVTGDAFRLAATDKHDIVNDTDRPTKLFFVKAPYIPEDKVPC